MSKETDEAKKNTTGFHPIKSLTQSSFISEFKEFINRGSVMDLAIGVAVGGAFTAIVKSLVDDIIMPVTSLLAGGLDFSTLSIDIPNIFGADTVAHIAYGNFIQNVVNFLIIAFTIFIIVKAMNKLNRAQDAAKEKLEQEAKEQEAKAKKNPPSNPNLPNPKLSPSSSNSPLRHYPLIPLR